jgi:Holliday junction resolvase RusA-like endonuclease
MTKIIGVSRFAPCVDGAGEGRTGDHKEVATRILAPSTGGFILELPMPPSVNTFTAKLGNSSNSVKAWRRHCDGLLMAMRTRPPKVSGPFTITVSWGIRYFGNRDIDNSLKPLLDYLERVELIDNDRCCWRAFVGFAPAPLGCVFHVKPAGDLNEILRHALDK